MKICSEEQCSVNRQEIGTLTAYKINQNGN
jgi:hypothetical protein